VFYAKFIVYSKKQEPDQQTQTQPLMKNRIITTRRTETPDSSPEMGGELLRLTS